MSKAGLAGFESVKGGAIWCPYQKGKKGSEGFKTFPAGDDSYIVGFYIGSKHDVGENKSTIHEFILKEAGNEEHINGEVVNGRVSVWGTGVLDDMISKNIQPGQCVAIVWKGKVDGEKRPYHTWDVMVNPNVEPMSVSAMAGPAPDTNPIGNDSSNEKSESPAPVNVGGESFDDDEDDDLPF